MENNNQLLKTPLSGRSNLIKNIEKLKISSKIIIALSSLFILWFGVLIFSVVNLTGLVNNYRYMQDFHYTRREARFTYVRAVDQIMNYANEIVWL
ncbi:MAG: hypothetical protein FWF50_01440, partial [Defluviitaleaceae bacterium]|nr:hypothetical protein [Defluviitaleaceae bacterium]